MRHEGVRWGTGWVLVLTSWLWSLCENSLYQHCIYICYPLLKCLPKIKQTKKKRNSYLSSNLKQTFNYKWHYPNSSTFEMHLDGQVILNEPWREQSRTRKEPLAFQRLKGYLIRKTKRGFHKRRNIRGHERTFSKQNTIVKQKAGYTQMHSWITWPHTWN